MDDVEIQYGIAMGTGVYNVYGATNTTGSLRKCAHPTGLRLLNQLHPMGQESTNFSYFLGGLALMSTVVSLMLCSSFYLPSSQMKILDELLQETRKIYDNSLSEDLIPDNLKVLFGEQLLQ